MYQLLINKEHRVRGGILYFFKKNQKAKTEQILGLLGFTRIIRVIGIIRFIRVTRVMQVTRIIRVVRVIGIIRIIIPCDIQAL